MNRKVETLLIEYAEAGGLDLSPKEGLLGIEEYLTLEEIELVKPFLVWVKKHRLTYGWNVRKVFGIYKSGNVAELKRYQNLLKRMQV